MRVSRKVRRDAKVYEWDGKAMTIKEWARELNVSERTMHRRMAWGWTGEKLFSRNLKEHNRSRYEGRRRASGSN